MGLKRLLLIHAFITLVASIVLVVSPPLIPRTVGIELAPSQYLLCYFLGAAELAIACLSFAAARLNDNQALQAVCTGFIVFHLATAALEVYALLQGTSARLMGNVFLRVLISALFYYYGRYRLQRRNKASHGKHSSE